MFPIEKNAPVHFIYATKSSISQYKCPSLQHPFPCQFHEHTNLLFMRKVDEIQKIGDRMKKTVHLNKLKD